MFPSKARNKINHIGLVYDMSGSMQPWQKEVVGVGDGLVRSIADLSRRLTEKTGVIQEARVTAATFNWKTDVLYYEVDALRLPSIKGDYHPTGGTALLDATIKMIEDLQKTAQLYGDHAFLLYVLTDGDENRSALGAETKLRRLFGSLPENWTTAILVPNEDGQKLAVRYGFPEGNTAIWDPTSTEGVQAGGVVIKAATEDHMTRFATDATYSGSKTLFSTAPESLNAVTVQAAGLTPLDPSKYVLVPVHHEMPIAEFVAKAGRTFTVGTCYYQLNKSEEIHGHKKIIVRNRATEELFEGDRVRDLIGLPRVTRRVSPKFNEDYDLFVQSTSVNRKLIPGTKLLILV